MATDIAAPDKHLQWVEDAKNNLLDSCQREFTFWAYDEEAGWQTTEDMTVEQVLHSMAGGTVDEIAADELSEFLKQVHADEAPATWKLTPGHHFLAISATCPETFKKFIATCDFQTDHPEQLLILGNLAQQSFKQNEKIASLQQENNFFLQQVSEDFENLTFLRFMADRLSLDCDANSLDEVIEDLLQRLGPAIKSQVLCYIDGQSSEGPTVHAIWTDGNPEVENFDPDKVVKLSQHFAADVKEQPMIKNNFIDPLQFKGIRDFILVEVATPISDIGWLLAVNRCQADRSLAEKLYWRLSQHEFGTNESSLLSTAATMLASHASNLNLFQEREELLVNVVRTLVSAVEAKDEYTCGHSERVAIYAKRLAEKLGYSEEECELLYLTGLLHDIGKIGISDAVLNKPDALTEEEFEEIKQHPDEGWAILRELQQLSYVLPGVLHHHERYDGRGYPDGLEGEEIPRDGRILAVADAFDAMTSNRAYRQGMPQSKAEEILKSGSGTQWDKEVIDAFFEVRDDITAMRENYQPRERPVRVSDKVPVNQ